jgi:3-oxoacyl-[acyl-carrier-protein] synthase II
MAERVVITGMGIVCPLAHDVRNLWAAFLAGKSGMAKTTIFDASTFPSTFDAEVKDYDLAKYTKNPHLHKHSNRGSGFAIGAAAQACKQAGIDIETDKPTDAIDRGRLGIYLGAGEGSVDNDVFFTALVEAWNPDKNEMNWGKWAKVAFDRMTPMRELEQEPNMPAAC